MDQIDLKILNILIEDIRTPIKVIAEQVFLSPAAVSQRIAAMRNKGILLPAHAHINPTALGYQFRAFIEVKVLRKDQPAFEAFLQDCHNVIEATYITGNYSAFIKAAFGTMDELAEFLRELGEFGETNTRMGLERIVTSRGVRVPKDLKTS